MSSFAPVLTPTVFYREPLAAMRWLERAFGFETAMLVTDSDGGLQQAEMSYRDAAIGIAGEWAGAQLGGARMVSPQSLEGAATQFIWVTVPSEIDAHCERARAAGAAITQAPETQFYGSRTYRARDLEGHVWNFRQTLEEVMSAEDTHKARGLTIKDKLD